MSVAQAVMEIPAAHQLNVFGQFDCNIKKIERAFGVTFVNRGETIRLSGTEEAVGKCFNFFFFGFSTFLSFPSERYTYPGSSPTII